MSPWARTVSRTESWSASKRAVRPAFSAPLVRGNRSACARFGRRSKSKAYMGACVCLTHTAARVIGGMTAHSFAQKYVNQGVFGGHVVLIDEIGFVSIDLSAQLKQPRLKGIRLLVGGDFP